MSLPTDSTIAHPYIEGRPGVQGGRAVIKGTRFPVSSIVQNHRRGCTAEEILRDFPQLTPAQVYDALSYYYDHRQQLDEEIATLSDAIAAAHRYPPTLRPSDDAD
jgi:uncharacterized protein (DUF433 family)